MSSIIIHSEENNELKFVLSGADISIANAIRRTILSDIPTVVFRAFGGESSDAIFTGNTGRLNNEILSQRLSCIPIHIQPNSEEYNIADLLLELDEENTTDVLRILTTDDFKIRNISTGLHLSKQKCSEIFKPFQSMTGETYPIQFARLRQRISDEIPGEKISMTCKFSIASASDNSMFNVVGTCAYGMTVDEASATDVLNEKQQKWRENGMTEPLVEIESLNWEFLDKKRIVLPNSFDFVVGTVGPISNTDIVATSCQILMSRCHRIIESIRNGLMIASNENENSIEYTLENEDYTIGNVLSHLLFKNYFEDNQTITFCGFKKLHPHDTDGIIRIMFKDSENSSSSSSSSKSKSKSKLRTSSSMGPPPLDTPPYATVEKVSPGYKDESNNSSAEKVSTGYASPGYASSSSETKGGGSTFQKIGFDYIKNCCNDAIEIFKKIEQSFINKKD